MNVKVNKVAASDFSYDYDQVPVAVRPHFVAFPPAAAAARLHVMIPCGRFCPPSAAQQRANFSPVKMLCYALKSVCETFAHLQKASVIKKEVLGTKQKYFFLYLLESLDEPLQHVGHPLNGHARVGLCRRRRRGDQPRVGVLPLLLPPRLLAAGGGGGEEKRPEIGAKKTESSKVFVI